MQKKGGGFFVGNKNETGRIGIKFGSDTVVKDGEFDYEYGQVVASELAEIKKDGIHAFLISSGAMALGTHRLGATAPRGERFREGQRILTEGWTNALRGVNLQPTEVVFTPQNIRWADRRVAEVLALGDVPLINGDDSSAAQYGEEIEHIANNDVLGGKRALTHGADFLIVTPTGGVLDDRGEILPMVTNMKQVVIFNRKSQNGTGGMRTKLESAFIVSKAGRRVSIAGTDHGTVRKFARREPVGTSITSIAA